MSQGFLDDYQIKAVRQMKNGCILNGSVGSGKSRTAIAYYYLLCGGEVLDGPMTKMTSPIDLYIITTAKKRDSQEWEEELASFAMHPDKSIMPYDINIVIDSWNNIKKYIGVEGAFFIFDEDRVTGNGTWVQSFYKIAKRNQWIILSATPGDKYEDYIPVFIANGFYKNITTFRKEHIVYKRFSKFPQVERYLGTKKLDRLRDSLLIEMDYKNPTIPHHTDILCEFDRDMYRKLVKEQWNPWEDAPIENASEYCYALRRVTNSSESRLLAILELFDKHDRIIIFYNFDYELEALEGLLSSAGIEYAQWNGHKHEKVPTGSRWAYLVQYLSAAEGWNCITTNCIAFFSQTYSYKTLVQACGRIDRRNTPYTHLYYYHLKSKSSIDIAISRTLKNKKEFNTRKFVAGKEFKRVEPSNKPAFQSKLSGSETKGE